MNTPLVPKPYPCLAPPKLKMKDLYCIITSLLKVKHVNHSQKRSQGKEFTATPHSPRGKGIRTKHHDIFQDVNSKYCLEFILSFIESFAWIIFGGHVHVLLYTSEGGNDTVFSWTVLTGICDIGDTLLDLVDKMWQKHLNIA